MRSLSTLFQTMLTLALLAGASGAFAQGGDLPDLRKYRDRQTFQDPYTNLQSAPEAAAPPKSDTTWQVPRLIFQNAPVVQRAWGLYTANTDTIVPGYRVQIFLGEPEEASRVKFEFMEAFEDVGVYSRYEAPYWKVRVGDFETMADAERFLQKVRKKFPGAFVVPEVVTLRSTPPPSRQNRENGETPGNSSPQAPGGGTYRGNGGR